MHEDVFVLASKPSYPLDTSGIDGWVIVKTVIRKTEERDLHSRPKVIFEHHVAPPERKP